MTWMLYGATGYTGRLITELALARGERPVLAGRSAERTAAMAAEFGLDHRVAAPDRVGDVLDGVDLVLSCAGPFSATADAVVSACLATGTHYVDIGGEIEVFERIYARDADARRSGVVLLPGAGFDVVPTDCFGARLAHELPGASTIEMAFLPSGGPSVGTARTMLEDLAGGNRSRVDGRIRVGRTRLRRVGFPSGERVVGSLPWADLVSTFRSTGIPNITVYTVLPGFTNRVGAGFYSAFGAMMRVPVLRRGVDALLRRFVTGPDATDRAAGPTELWGRVRDASGGVVTMTGTTPHGYDVTADAAVKVVRRVLDGGVDAGAHTPSSAFGWTFLLDLDGVELSEPVRTRA